MFSSPSSRFCCCPVFRFIPSNELAYAFYLFVSTKSSAPFSSHQNISRSTPPSSLPYSQSCVASKSWGTRMYFNVWQFPKVMNEWWTQKYFIQPKTLISQIGGYNIFCKIARQPTAKNFIFCEILRQPTAEELERSGYTCPVCLDRWEDCLFWHLETLT